jgi:hypothetical protein
VRQQEYERSVRMGHENAEVIDLVRDHCRLARVEAVHGNSMVGEALGIPMGLLEVRCEHASPAASQGHNLLPIVAHLSRPAESDH